MLRAREITTTNQNKSYYKGRNEINQNGVVYTQNNKSREFCYKQNFRYIAKISLYTENSSVAKFCFSTVPLLPAATIPSSCFDILHSRLAEIDRKPYEIDGNQPDFVMIGLTQRFGFQFLQKL